MSIFVVLASELLANRLWLGTDEDFLEAWIVSERVPFPARAQITCYWLSVIGCSLIKMTLEEKSRLEALDRVVRSSAVREQISQVIERVRAELARKPEALMTWEPIPLEPFGDGLPSEIRSSWVFVLRAGADTGAERHPNSHQRMMSILGSGDMRTATGGSHVESLKDSEIGWHSNHLISEPGEPLEQRWISIPPNVWHCPVVDRQSDWVVVSFHTVPARELIEERPSPASGDEMKQMRYLDQ
jgi:hypothetical protein